MNNLGSKSPKQRVLDKSLAVGNPTSIATVELMEQVGVYFPDAHLAPEKMAQLAAAGHELLGFDTIAPYFSVQQEAEALGCNVEWGNEKTMPAVRHHQHLSPEQIDIPTNLLEKPSLRVVLDAISILHNRYKDVAIVGKTMGPWTLAYHIGGIEEFLMKLILEPDAVRKYLDILKEVTIKFGTAQLQAGADVLVIADHATGDLISRKHYQKFLFPVHQEIVERLNCPTILHICGNTLDRIPDIAAAGFDYFHFESKVEANQAVQAANGQLALAGNINNPEVLLRETPEEVYHAVKQAVNAGVTMIGPECAVPLQTPLRNLRAIRDAVDDLF